MAHNKKSRKQGQIGTPKANIRSPQASDKKKKANKGHASGSRNSLVAQDKADTASNTQNKDRRLGSKRKIDLLDTKKSELKQRVIPKFKSPMEELDFIEGDKKLQSLLDRLDTEVAITAEEQSYVDTLLNRHRILCDLMGIDSDEQDSNEEDDEIIEDRETVNEPSNKSEDLLDKLDKDFKF